jgi:cob(I)alamin adenosyltransferase
MLIVYTGPGKGKTSAAVGQTVRALGQDLRTAFGQFMKRPGQAGEQRMLERLLGTRFRAGGLGFLRNEEDRPAHRESALALLSWARGQLVSGLEMLVLDEALYALGADLLTREEIESLARDAAAADCHLVLTGRGLPEWLHEMAQLVTEMGEVKHPFHAGVKAGRGIEY